NQTQRLTLVLWRKMLLIVGWRVVLLIRKYPDLVKMNAFCRRRVELTVRNAGARAHVLHVPGTNHRTVAHAVFMHEGPVQNVGDDFHIAVRVRGETAATGDAVIVHDAQGAKVGVARVVILGERKGKASVEPAVVGLAAVVALPNSNHRWPPDLISKGIILVITTIVKRLFNPSTAGRAAHGVVRSTSGALLISRRRSPDFHGDNVWCKVLFHAAHPCTVFFEVIDGFCCFDNANKKRRGFFLGAPQYGNHYRQPHRQVLRDSDHPRHHSSHGSATDQSEPE